jgi:Carbohydrate/starch-binding module (family 21)
MYSYRKGKLAVRKDAPSDDAIRKLPTELPFQTNNVKVGEPMPPDKDKCNETEKMESPQADTTVNDTLVNSKAILDAAPGTLASVEIECDLPTVKLETCEHSTYLESKHADAIPCHSSDDTVAVVDAATPSTIASALVEDASVTPALHEEQEILTNLALEQTEATLSYNWLVVVTDAATPIAIASACELPTVTHENCKLTASFDAKPTEVTPVYKLDDTVTLNDVTTLSTLASVEVKCHTSDDENYQLPTPQEPRQTEARIPYQPKDTIALLDVATTSTFATDTEERRTATKKQEKRPLPKLQIITQVNSFAKIEPEDADRDSAVSFVEKGKPTKSFQFSATLEVIRHFDKYANVQSVKDVESIDVQDSNDLDLPSMSSSLRIPDTWVIRSKSMAAGNLRAHSMVVVDSVKMVDTDQLRIAVMLKNIAYEKQVTIRYSTDNWITYNDVFAKFDTTVTANVNHYPVIDRFVAVLDTSTLQGTGANFDYAVCYKAAGVEHWDNNGGRNHKVLKH